MGQINTNNYPTVSSLLDADLLIVENATNGTGTTTPKQLRENAIGTDTLQTSAQTVTGAINELKREIDAGAGVVCYDVNTITSGYLGGQFSGSANLLLLHLTTDGIADSTNGYMMLLSYSRPVARFAIGRLVDADGVAYKQDVYADNTIICTISGSGEGTESDPVQVVILGIINAGFMLTPTAVVSDRDIIDGQGNTLSVLAEALTKTASGNPVVITDCAGGKARSLITEINAIQDLHGYDKPWVGGAGKNKFGGGTFTGSLATHTFDVLTGACKVTSTGTGNNSQIAIRFDNISDLKGQTVTFSIKDYALSDNNLKPYVIWYKNGSSGISNSSLCDSPTSGITKLSTSFIIPDDADYVVLLIRLDQNTQQTVGDYIQIHELQLEIGSSKTSFAPYSNICPISGRSSVVITRSDGDEISEDFTIQLGTTVYGADINWDTGVASITHVLLVNNTADMDNSEDWPGWRTSGIRQYIGGGINRVFTGQTMNIGTVYGANTTGNDDTLILPKDTYNLSQTEWKALSTDVQIIVPLATPTTIQLTPKQLEMLKGYNRVTIESGSIELGYIAKLT